MTRLSNLALSLLAATPLCHSFAPSTPNVAQRGLVLRASTADDDVTARRTIEQVGKVAAAALLAATLTLSHDVNAAVDTAYIHGPLTSTSTLTSIDDAADKSALEILEKETKALEKETAQLKKKARVERGKEAFYDYEAKMAAETEARIEESERKAEMEYEKDKAEVEALALLELKKEQDAKLATTPAQKRALENEARLLLKKEKELERKEKKAERAERIFLAEEAREKEILKAKLEAAKKEDAKFEEIEKEYEKDLELVKQEEAELSLVKELMEKKK